MTNAFSLASWNVEHFKGKKKRTNRIIKFMNDQEPDIFALYEVEAKESFNTLIRQMSDYQFHITEGSQTQEILVGVKNDFTAFFTQRLEFKSGNQYLRPGAFLTLNIDNVFYSILFMHTKSSSFPIGLGIRDDQFQHAFRLKKKLDKRGGGEGKANFMFLGDLNTMGMEYPFHKDIKPKIELDKLKREADKVKMRPLTKNKPYTWWNGPGSRYKPGDFDHVVASKQLKFKKFSGADVDVRGWPAIETENEQAEWIEKYSDHGMLFLIVENV